MIELLLALVTISAADINRDPMAMTHRLQARGLRVRTFVAPATAEAVNAIVDVRSQRVAEGDASVHDDFDESAAQRAELARLRTVRVTRDSVRIPADYPYDLQIVVGRAPYSGLGPVYDAHGHLPMTGPGPHTFTPWSPIEVLRQP